ncbi:baculoviral IAP repeat-containing protein 3-like [Haliotis rubra]|uniref:baculoviral IAP repeat-containing protein 3-like n=1 Tax=Haliotis rubra TaxID=36100 RepID=UPI001EE5E1E7|nr:baculoviral IAP repeat-containing protein 3-like [Haliotis rubra]
MDVSDAVGVSPAVTESQALQGGVSFDEIMDTGAPGEATTEKEAIQSRLATFQHWTGVTLPLQLAVAGFAYTGEVDKVVCTFCGIMMYNWTSKEIPLEVHRKYSPDCPFLKKWFPMTEGERSAAPPGERVGYDATKAKHKEYITFAQRLSSFVGWPLTGDIHSSRNMSMAGFFYIGSADRARCFYCALTLRDWDTNDDPIFTHKQWSPQCGYINHITSVAVKTRIRSQGNPSGNRLQQSSKASAANSSTVTIPPGINRKAEGALSNPGGTWEHSPSVQALLDFGYSINVVQEAIKKHKEKYGHDFRDSTDLYRAIEEIEN